MTRHIKRRIRQLQRLEKALVCVAGVFFVGFLIMASALDSASWLPMIYCVISIGAAGVIGWAGEHVQLMILEEQERLAVKLEYMERRQRA